MQPYRFLPTLGRELIDWKLRASLITLAADIIALAAWNRSSLRDTAGSSIVIASLCLRMAASVSLLCLLGHEKVRHFLVRKTL